MFADGLTLGMPVELLPCAKMDGLLARLLLDAVVVWISGLLPADEKISWEYAGRPFCWDMVEGVVDTLPAVGVTSRLFAMVNVGCFHGRPAKEPVPACDAGVLSGVDAPVGIITWLSVMHEPMGDCTVTFSGRAGF